jgi:hypothetical protein
MSDILEQAGKLRNHPNEWIRGRLQSLRDQGLAETIINSMIPHFEQMVETETSDSVREGLGLEKRAVEKPEPVDEDTNEIREWMGLGKIKEKKRE